VVFLSLSIIVVILFVSLILRCGLAGVTCFLTQDFTFSYQPDSGSYIESAESLLHSGTFSILGFPEIGRTPGYPFLLMLGIISGHLELVTIVVQILLSCFTVFLVF
jgi:hypothetical protein